MAYVLHYDDVTVTPYLFALNLSRAGRIILAAALDQEFRILGDAYINDPSRRLSTESDCFRVDLLFRDPVRRMMHNLHFIISDSAAQYGVLRIVYVEDFSGP